MIRASAATGHQAARGISGEPAPISAYAGVRAFSCRPAEPELDLPPSGACIGRCCRERRTHGRRAAPDDWLLGRLEQRAPGVFAQRGSLPHPGRLSRRASTAARSRCCPSTGPPALRSSRSSRCPLPRPLRLRRSARVARRSHWPPTRRRVSRRAVTRSTPDPRRRPRLGHHHRARCARGNRTGPPTAPSMCDCHLDLMYGLDRNDLFTVPRR